MVSSILQLFAQIKSRRRGAFPGNEPAWAVSRLPGAETGETVRRSRPFAHKGVWVEPKLFAEVEYRAKSAEENVRHPFFKGLREDLQ